jgi:hypothetical protein
MIQNLLVVIALSWANNALHLTASTSRLCYVAKIRAARYDSRVAWAAGELER